MGQGIEPRTAPVVSVCDLSRWLPPYHYRAFPELRGILRAFPRLNQLFGFTVPRVPALLRL